MLSNHNYFQMDEDLFLAIAYVSPAYSSYSTQRDNIFELLENDLAHFGALGACLVTGDFNARTATEPDYCCFDNGMEYIDLPVNMKLDVPIPRTNSDNHIPDNHGKQLLQLCKTAGIRILNGRFLGDYSGFSTCFSFNGSPSVIDYMVASEKLLPSVESFHVHNPTHVSIHCLLSTTIRTRPYFAVKKSVT